MTHWAKPQGLLLTVNTAPTTEPVSTANAKIYARIDGSDDDTLVDVLIGAAREKIEQITRRALLTQTWDMYLDAFPWGDIIVPKPPLQSVTSITYTDTDGATQTWSSSEYTVDTDSEPARIVTAFGEDYPDTRDVIKAVKVTFKAGYGDAATAVPDAIITAVKMLVMTWYDHRDTVIEGTSAQEVPNTVDALLSSYRIPSFG
jgi:uncharacterized phiE125 gp8 family phage protein